jgi:hypothetical protein
LKFNEYFSSLLSGSKKKNNRSNAAEPYKTSSSKEIEQVKTLTLIQKFIGILSSPIITFKSISRLPDSKIPLINFFSVIILTSLSFLTITSHIQVSGSESFIGAFNFYLLGNFFNIFIINVISVLLIWVIITFVFWTISKYLFQKRSYGDTFKVILHAFIPIIFSRIILIFLTLIGLSNIIIFEGMSVIEVNSQIQILFNSDIWLIYYIIDAIVWLWSALLISFALREFNKIEIKKALVISYSIISIFILFTFLAR